MQIPAVSLLSQLPCITLSSSFLSSSSFSNSSSSSSSLHTWRTQAFQHCFPLPRKRQIKQGCGVETPPAPPSVFLFITFFWEAEFKIAGCATAAATLEKHEMRSVFFGDWCGVKCSKDLIFIHAGRDLFKTMKPPSPSPPPTQAKQQLRQRFCRHPEPQHPSTPPPLPPSLAYLSPHFSLSAPLPLSRSEPPACYHIIH